MPIVVLAAMASLPRRNPARSARASSASVAAVKIRRAYSASVSPALVSVTPWGVDRRAAPKEIAPAIGPASTPQADLPSASAAAGNTSGFRDCMKRRKMGQINGITKIIADIESMSLIHGLFCDEDAPATYQEI